MASLSSLGQQVHVSASGNSSSHSSVAGVAQGVVLAIGLTMTASSYANSGSATSEISSYDVETVSTVKSNQTTSVTSPKLQIALAQKGDSVGSFMLKNFGTIHGWELLVSEKGQRVIDPCKDLVAGEKYFLAKDYTQVEMLQKIAQKKASTVITEKKAPVVVAKYVSSGVDTVIQKAQELGMDFQGYSHSIAFVESNHRYNIDNTKKGRKLNIDPSDWAFGKHQFTSETLASYGIRTPEQRSKFLHSPEQQEKLMQRYTLDHIKFILKEPVLTSLIKAGVQPNHMLSAMHHRGWGGVKRIAEKSVYSSNPVTAFYAELKKAKGDWLGTSTYDYIKATSSKYSSFVKAPSHEPVANYEASTLPQTESLINTVKKVSFSTVSTNDAHFETKRVQKPKVFASVNDVRSSNEKKVNAILQTNALVASSQSIAFTPVAGETTQVVQSLVETEYREEVMEKIQNDITINPEVRKSILAKLHKTNLLTLCKNNIERYEADKVAWTAKEQREAVTILPNLYKLLAKIEGEMENRMEDHRMIASNSNTYLRAA